MMTQEFRLPDPGEGIHEAEILDVCVSAGQAVREGESILQIETDKAIVEVPSPCTGTVAEIKVTKGDVVRVGEVLMTFTTGEEGKRPVKLGRSADAVAGGATEGQQQRQPADAVQAVERAPQKVVAAQTNGHPVPASPATRRLAMELGVDLQAVPGSGPGGRVMTEDVRAFAGKAAQAVPPATVQEAETRVREEAAPAEAPEEREAAPRRGRPLALELPPLPDFSRWGPVQQVPLQGVRRATARQMSLAWAQIPHVMHQDMADITALEMFRRQHAAEVEQRGGKLSLTVLVLRAVVAVLKQFPRFNASLDPEGGQLILKQYYHIGVAVDTERGLIVPVVRDVDRKSMAELAMELTELVEQVRHGKVNHDDLQGGTFTITNPGAIGGTTFTPIIHYPEVAILGLARTRLEPVVQGDIDHFTVVPRLCLPLHLAFDHRVNDGADAARFVRTLIDTLRDPESFLLRV
jgi:pyruvate dehydrogenase E2 component (dihydrolipoamide acetyltransferase)